jgi:uncharacterized protein YegL
MSDQIEYAGFELSEFAENPEPRVPCVLLLDTSGSMSTVVGDSGEAARNSVAQDGILYKTPPRVATRIDSLNEGLVTFKETLAADSLASRRAEIAIVTFGGVVTIVQDFVTAQHFYPPRLDATGSTPMGSAILAGLDMITKRKSVYKAAGIAYYRPWVFLITDGDPDPGDPWMAAAEKVKQGEASKSLAFFTVGVEGANMNVLSQIALRQPVKLKGVNFREMFLWLSQSMQAVSQSSPNDQVPLSPPGWAEV